MNSSPYDVLVVGAGAAGLTAAIGLARARFRVAVVESAAFPGAEQTPGSVLPCESLAHPDILGPDGVMALPSERRLVERGVFATDGSSLLGTTYRDDKEFAHCQIIVPPVFYRRLADHAIEQGALLLANTVVESVIREDQRVIGVCTNRGPLYANLVFLVEGAAAHLAAREGYERSTDPREAPHFLLEVSQLFELSQGAIEERFHVGPDDGAAYELLIRNPTWQGRRLGLNLRGLVSTLRDRISVGLLVPAEKLQDGFDSTPRGLLEWFTSLPALKPWLHDAQPREYSARLRRNGGPRDIPQLVEAGLALGGETAALGTDFPYANFLGPASRTGLLLVRAACHIRAEGGSFTLDALNRHYVEALRQSQAWRDVEFLRRWPAYVRKTSVLFDAELDLLVGSAHVWTRPRQWFLVKWTNWLRLMRATAPPARWSDLSADWRDRVRALRLREVAGRPGLGWLLLDGTLNAIRDLFGSKRTRLTAAGGVRLHFISGDRAEPIDLLPTPLRRWFNRFAAVLAPMAQHIYASPEEPISTRVAYAARLLLKQVNLLDVLLLAVLILATALSACVMAACGLLMRSLGLRRGSRSARALYPRYAERLGQVIDLALAANVPARLVPATAGPAQREMAGLPVIHLRGPRTLPDPDRATEQALEHVCPTEVFRTRADIAGQLRVSVQPEKCIRCEICWRINRLVDWGRQALPDAISGPFPRFDPWQRAAQPLAEIVRADRDVAGGSPISELTGLLDQLEHKLAEFDIALARAPSRIDRPRADYLELLARYAQQLAGAFLEGLDRSAWSHSDNPDVVRASALMHEVAGALLAKTEEGARRAWNQHYAWAAADGRQIRQHHLPGLRHFLGLFGAAHGIDLPPQATAPHPEDWPQGGIGLLDREFISQVRELARSASGNPESARGETAGRIASLRILAAEDAADHYLLEIMAAAAKSEASARSEKHGRLLRALINSVPLPKPQNPGEIFRQHGSRLLEGWQSDGSALEGYEDSEELPVLRQLVQRKTLEAELTELGQQRARLTRLVNDWPADRGPGFPGFPGAKDTTTDAEFVESLALQDALLLAGKLVLLRTHERMESGFESEIEVALVHVWLEKLARALDRFESQAPLRFTKSELVSDRPLLEPDAGHLPATLEEFLAANAVRSEFLHEPINLLHPRLMPEMLEEEPANSVMQRLVEWEEAAEAAFIQQGIVEMLAASSALDDLAQHGRKLAGSYHDVPAWLAWRLQRLDEDRFCLQSVACDVAGRLRLPQSESVNLEVAAVALLARRLTQRANVMLETSPSSREPWASANRALAQGSRLDGEELSIILKTLAEHVLPRWDHEDAALTPRHLGREVLTLEALKNSFREWCRKAWKTLGQEMWQDPELQVSCYPLAESAAWLKAMDSTLGRMAWLSRHRQAEVDADPTPLLRLARRVLTRCESEVRLLLQHANDNLARLRRGHASPEIQAAGVLLRDVE